MLRRTLLLTTVVPIAAAHAADPWDALRQGGIALFRHASAPGVGDPPGFRLGDCATQRNLGDVGRRQAAAIGARFRAERIAVGRVIGSEWCRTRETGALAFEGAFQPEPAFNSFFDDPARRAAQTRAALAVLAAWQGPGALVVVTHQVNITALTGIVPADAEGVAVRVVNDRVDVIGTLRV